MMCSVADQRLKMFNGELGRLTAWVYKEVNKETGGIESSEVKYFGLHWSIQVGSFRKLVEIWMYYLVLRHSWISKCVCSSANAGTRSEHSSIHFPFRMKTKSEMFKCSPRSATDHM